MQMKPVWLSSHPPWRQRNHTLFRLSTLAYESHRFLEQKEVPSCLTNATDANDTCTVRHRHCVMCDEQSRPSFWVINNNKLYLCSTEWRNGEYVRIGTLPHGHDSWALDSCDLSRTNCIVNFSSQEGKQKLTYHTPPRKLLDSWMERRVIWEVGQELESINVVEIGRASCRERV